MEHVVNHLRKKNRNFRRNVSDVHIIKGKLYNEIISEYEKAKDKSNEKARESAEKHHGNPDKEKDKEATPFR